jgi:hypothetical protein
MRALLTGGLIVLLSGAAAGTAAAQSSTGTAPGIRPSPREADIRLRYVAEDADPVGSRLQSSAHLATLASDRRTGRALMIVGVAGIVTGLIVDESIVTIAGAGVGGYGLYLYLR